MIRSLPMRINLISISCLAAFNILMGISGAMVILTNERHNATSRAELAVSETAAAAERMLAEGRAIGALPGFDEFCSGIVESDEILGGAAVFDVGGRRLYAGGRVGVAWPGLPELSGAGKGRIALLGRGMVAVHPLFASEGAAAGFAVVAVDERALGGSIRWLIGIMVLMSVPLVAATAAVQGVLFRRSIGIPLRRLVTVADSLAGGGIGKVSDLERYAGPGDIGTIYAAFARLVGRLLEAQADLVSQNKELDETVGKRTELLEGAYAELAADIARRSALERELMAAKVGAEAASKAKSLFLASMSHEIRTPMNSVLGYLELLSRGSLGEDEREYVSVIESNARHLLAVIDDILDLSKYESERFALAEAPFDPAQAVERAAAMLEPRAAEKGVALAVRADRAPLCLGDGQRLGQVLVNLVGNAVKFTPRGGRVEVVLSASREEGGVRLSVSVSDTGIGIVRDKLQVIFEDFGQADSTIAGRYGGTGLGLAISSRLVRAMGGEIGVESEPGKGSRFAFSILLPEAGPRADRQAAGAEGSGAEGSGAAFAGMDALVAEDTKDSRALVARMLGMLGMSADAVSDGAEALELFRAKRYDVVILDGYMPVMDGVETARRMRELERGSGQPRTPIIALSAKVLPEEREEFLRSGADGFVAKPVSLAALAEAISRAVGAEAMDETRAAGDAAARVASRSGLDKAFAAELLGEFTSSLPRRLEAADAALGGRDADRLGRAAHGLRGSALNLGLDVLARAARELESAAARAGEEGAWPEAEKAVEALRGVVKAFLAERSG
jgi:signal transduction histidine kinase/CheY-like chemotaxis protein/HPt (histidine-containing phosphotransfer) domain-containing protein